ncbi:hypothetical protein C0J52_00233 [Blattella germanica]|nr:hypothetical protein C0J52_00233 [Blattella germanica]
MGLHVDGNAIITDPTESESTAEQNTATTDTEDTRIINIQFQPLEQTPTQVLQEQQHPPQSLMQQVGELPQPQPSPETSEPPTAPSPVDIKPIVEEIPQENTVSSSGIGTIPPVVLKIENTVVKQEEPPDIKPIIKEEPKLVPGKLAVCHFCGYTSADFFRCQRCKRKLPENCKSIAVPENKKKPLKEIITAEKFYSKTPVKVETVEVPKGRARGRNSKKNKSKLVEEPVCLTLSSDDEESTQSELDSMTSDRALNNGQRLSADGIPLTQPDPEVTSSAMGKEPVIAEEDDAGSDTGENQHSQGVRVPGMFTLLQCRTVRIGSYKVVPKDRVLLSSIGIRISVPAIEDESKNVMLTVNIKDIVKVLIHFGRGMPVLFFYINPTPAARIRAALNMESKLGPYYDPSSQDETQRRITLLPERLNEDSKVALKTIFGSLSNNVLEELNNKEANDILVRASPKEVQNMMKKAVGMSPTKVKDEIQTILVYPPPPSKGGIPINTEDYACLGEDQFLNDVIIDFYLKYLTLSVLSEEDQARTHVFSSFFYKRLTTRPPKSRRSHPVEDDPKLSPAEKRHSRVKSWTKNVNIFEKDFIIIPINEHCHWFLAIICFPGLKGSVRFSDNTPVVVQNVKKVKKALPKKNSGAIEDCAKGAVQIGSTTITPIKPPCTTITLEPCEDGSDRDEAEADDDEMEQGTSEEEDNGVANPPETPEKHPLFSEPTLEEPPAPPPKLPAKSKSGKPDPIRDYNLPLKNLVTWFSEELVSGKREEIQKLLLRLLEKNNVDIESLNLPKLSFSGNQSGSETQDDESDEDEYYARYKMGHLFESWCRNPDMMSLPPHSHDSLVIFGDNAYNNVDTSSMEIQSQETVAGGLLFSCTEEDECEDEESEMTECSVGNGSDISSPQKLCGSDKKLVDYNNSDEGEGEEEQKPTPMEVDTPKLSVVSLPIPQPTVSLADEGKRNTMQFLKNKRIERHTRGIDNIPMATDDPTDVENWVRERVLGSGGFGEVTLWKHKTQDSMIALKKCRTGTDALLTKKHKERWSKEVDIMQRLNHPNVVKAIAVPPELSVLRSELPLMCMEYCSKESEVRSLISDVKSAVQYLHSMKITHRDLKPENIVLQQEKTRELDQSSICTSFVGTLQYLAPELFMSKTMKHVREKSSDDICAIQSQDGNIVFSKELFPQNHISTCLKYHMERWLKHLLEWDAAKRGRAQNNSKEIRWIERDSGLSVKEQELILPSGQAFDTTKEACQCWKPPEPGNQGDTIMVYAFRRGSMVVEEITPRIPQTVGKMMEEPRNPIEYIHQKRAWSHAVFFLQQEMDLYHTYLKAYRVKMVHVYSNNMPSELVATWTKINETISKQVVKLKEAIQQLEHKCEVANSKTVELQRNTGFEAGLKCYDNLRRRSKEVRQQRMDSVDMVKVVYNCLKQRDRLLRDEEFHSHIKIDFNAPEQSNGYREPPVVASSTKPEVPPHGTPLSQPRRSSRDHDFEISSIDPNKNRVSLAPLVAAANSLTLEDATSMPNSASLNLPQQADTTSMINENKNLRYTTQGMMNYSYQQYRQFMSEDQSLDWTSFEEVIYLKEEFIIQFSYYDAFQFFKVISFVNS